MRVVIINGSPRTNGLTAGENDGCGDVYADVRKREALGICQNGIFDKLRWINNGGKERKMKKKVIVLCLLVLCLLVGCAKKQVVQKIQTPNADEVEMILLITDEGEVSIHGRPFIEAAIQGCKEAKATGRQSDSDSMQGENLVLVKLFGADETELMVYYLYKLDGKAYLEIPSEGIWEVYNEYQGMMYQTFVGNPKDQK